MVKDKMTAILFLPSECWTINITFEYQTISQPDWFITGIVSFSDPHCIINEILCKIL